MSAKFYDLQDESNPDSGSEVFDGQAIRLLLARNTSRRMFFAELRSGDETKLLIGLGPKICCAQFSALNDEPPYLMARLNSEEARSGTAEFLIGNTPSEVPLRLCVPLGVLLDVAAHFVETGQRSQIVSWEEI